MLYEKDEPIGRITLNRPTLINAIDDDLPGELSAAVAKADANPDVHVMVLAANGPAFCAGYDLAYYAEQTGQQRHRPADALGRARGLRSHVAQHPALHVAIARQ